MKKILVVFMLIIVTVPKSWAQINPNHTNLPSTFTVVVYDTLQSSMNIMAINNWLIEQLGEELYVKAVNSMSVRTHHQELFSYIQFALTYVTQNIVTHEDRLTIMVELQGRYLNFIRAMARLGLDIPWMQEQPSWIINE